MARLFPSGTHKTHKTHVEKDYARSQIFIHGF